MFSTTGSLQRLALLALLAMTWFSPAQATILTFDFQPRLNQNDPIPQSYGDNVTATTMGAFNYGVGNGFTPNITVSYRTLLGDGSVKFNDVLFWDTGYSTLVDVAIANAFDDGSGNGDVGYGEITFTPSGGVFVIINSFQMAAFNTAGDQLNQVVRILDQFNNVVWGGPTDILVGQVYTFTPGVISNGPLRLQFGNSWFVGIDNINFDEASSEIPEPASLVLAGLGLAALGYLRRCQS